MAHSKKSGKSSKAHSVKGDTVAQNSTARRQLQDWHIFLGILAAIVIIIALIAVFKPSLLGRGHVDDIAAKVNGEAISQQFIDEQYARIPAQYKAVLSKAALLNQTIMTQLVLQEAKKADVIVSDEELDVAFTKIVESTGLTPEQFQQRLAQQNVTEAFLRDEYRKQLIVNKYLDEKVFNDITITEEQARSYYDSTIRASHILVKSEDEAKAIIAQLDAGASFASLASASIDTVSAAQGGDLGDFAKGIMVPEFESAAFALTVGEYTKEPVKTQFGYHVILRTPKAESFDAAKETIKEQLKNQEKSARLPAYLDDLRADANIIVYMEE